MGQAIHIFKKDVRHLRFEIAIAITVTALFAFIETKHALWPVDAVYSDTPASYLALLLLPVAWWMLIGRAVHDEALPGDRQFWITRPYSWRSLLSAKLLFILAFVNLPMLIAQIVIVHAYGFSIGAELTGLLWSQVLLTIVFVLPVLAISALTTGFAQLIAGMLVPCVIALALASVKFKYQFFLFGITSVFVSGPGWVWSYLVFLIIAIAAPAILFWQYRRRGTTVARCFVGAAWILVAMVFYLISWNTTYKIDSALFPTRVDLSAARIVSDLAGKKPRMSFRQGGDDVRLNVPFQLTGLPSGATARVEYLSASFQAPDGTTWSADGFTWENPEGPDQQFSFGSGFNGGRYLTSNDVPVKVHGTLYFAVFGNARTTTVPFGDHFVPVEQVGLCSATESFIESSEHRKYLLICNSAFRSPTGLVSYRFVQSDQGITSKDNFRPLVQQRQILFTGSYSTADNFRPFIQQRQLSLSPFPAEVRISPVSEEYTSYNDLRTWNQVAIQTLEPLGHIRLDFDVDLGRATMYGSNNNEKIRPGSN
jgi:hypothetical protein